MELLQWSSWGPLIFERMPCCVQAAACGGEKGAIADTWFQGTTQACK